MKRLQIIQKISEYGIVAVIRAKIIMDVVTN